MNSWRIKSIEYMESEADSGAQKLERRLGSVSLILLGIGAIIGAGVFSITGIVAAQNAGPAVIISFILAAISCAFAGLCFSELAAMIPISGGAYSYTYTTLGEFAAWMIGWSLLLEYAMGAAAVAISWSAYVVSLLKDFGIHLPTLFISSPWQPIELMNGVTAYGILNVPALIIVFLLSLLAINGIDKSAQVNAVLVVVKVAVVLLFIGIGIFYIQADHYQPFIPTNTGEFGSFGWTGILRGAGMIFFAYIGFDAVSTAAQEVKKPQRDLPIGIIGSLVICTILYVLFAYVLVGIVPFGQLNVAAPVAEAINRTPFPWLNLAIKIAIIAGLTSVILVLLLAQSRIFYTMSRDGLLPPAFAAIHPRLRTPWISSLIVMFIIAPFCAFAPIALVGELTSIGTLFIFAIVCASVLVLRKTRPDLKRPFKTPLVPLVPVLGVVICSLLMLFLGVAAWMRFLGWMAIGLVFYFLYGRRYSHLALLETDKGTGSYKSIVSEPAGS